MGGQECMACICSLLLRFYQSTLSILLLLSQKKGVSAWFYTDNKRSLKIVLDNSTVGCTLCLLTVRKMSAVRQGVCVSTLDTELENVKLCPPPLPTGTLWGRHVGPVSTAPAWLQRDSTWTTAAHPWMLVSPYLSLVTMDTPNHHHLRTPKTLGLRGIALLLFPHQHHPHIPSIRNSHVTMVCSSPLNPLSTNQMQGAMASQTPGVCPYYMGLASGAFCLCCLT